ncbi:hypothetical protein GF345_02890 [Candidatus Woesearchaeota archaeon]|nr:hypothetical protein [Candidatus Woesearchaeota archaeon]
MIKMESQVRQTAIKARISHLINGRYVVQEGWEPNYILHNDSRISRANIIGVAVSKNQSEFSNNTSIILDDGSGRINVRSFEENSSLNSVSVGDVLLIVGRPRQYGDEIYLVPEIARKIEDQRWVDVRKKELASIDAAPAAEPDQQEKSGQGAADDSGEIETEVIEDHEDHDDGSGAQAGSAVAHGQDQDADSGQSGPDKVMAAIKKADSGDGAAFEEIISSSRVDNAEDIISNLLKNGDIFEIRPGRLKMLD